jgi:tetratricopeptide (TPR) repeat protein
MQHTGKLMKARTAGFLSGWLLAASLVYPAMAADKPQYMPPMAPTLDTTPVQSTHASADSSDAGNAGDGDSAKEEQIKSLMRQALEKHGQGDVAGAEKLLHKVLTIDPANGDANFNLGALSEERHDLKGAAQYYEAAARANPRDTDIRDALSGVRDQIRNHQSENQSAQQLEQKAQLRKLGEQAAAAYKAGNYDQAITYLRSIEAQQPNDANVQFALGQAFHGRGDDVHAREFLRHAVELAPDNQLYAATLKDMEQQPTRSASGDPSGATPAAPRRKRTLDDQIAADQEWEQGERQSAGPAGDGVQPFTSQGEDQLPRSSASQYGSLEASGMGGLPGGLPASMLPGLAALGLGLGSLGMGMGIGTGVPMGMPMGVGSMYGGATPYGMPGYTPMYPTPYYGYPPRTTYPYPSYYGGGYRGYGGRHWR